MSIVRPLQGAVNDRQGATAWHARAGELARWTWDRLVNRTDAWGGYVAEVDRGREYRRADGQVERLGKTLTRPPVRDRGKVSLAVAHLERHFRARRPEDVLGVDRSAVREHHRFPFCQFLADWAVRHTEGR